MIQYKRPNAFFLAMLAGLPAVLLIGSSARAQYAVGSGGHANDANNRIGSGGINEHSDFTNRSALNSGIVTGNVSGLNYFHGNSEEFDPNVFQQGTASGNSDRLNSIAAPVNLAKPNNGTPNFTQYYNASQYAAPAPPRFVTTAGGQGYIPAPELSSETPSSDTRINNDLSSSPTDSLPTPGELNVVGPVDPSGNASLYSMSPLYGIRAQQGQNPDDNSFLDRTTNARATTPADRARMDPQAVEKMREELNKTVLPDDQTGQPAGNPAVPGAIDVNKSQSVSDGATVSPLLSGAKPLTSSVAGQQLNGDLASGESVQSTLVIAPGKQSKQLADLEKKYAQSDQKLTDVQATDRLNKEMQAQAKPATLDGADGSKPGQTPPAIGTGAPIGGGSTPTPIGQTPASPEIKPILHGPDHAQPTDQPYVITSLATGIDAKGLATLMKSAEEQMRGGKFTEAVASYETAEQVAPNNPFVFLGRSFSELGASYYGKADADLSHAITSEPAVLVGRYDLKGFLGEERLAFVQKDLQDIADHEKGARPLILLAYIAHNTGDDAAAARNLNDANTRGGYTRLIDLMQGAWGLKPAKP